MSAEVAKKRGRPKKVISDPVEVELPETTKKATARVKSTKTTTKTVKAASATPSKATTAKKNLSKAAGTSAAPKIATKSAAPSAKAVGKPLVAKPTPTTPTTSKILEQVKELEEKKAAVSQESPKETTAKAGKTKVESVEEPAEGEGLRQQLSSEPATELSKSQPTTISKSTPTPSPSQSKPIPSSSTKSTDPKPTAKAPPAPTPPTKSKSTPPPPPPPSAAKPKPKPTPPPTPKPHIPIAELNSAIVSGITTRAGAKPNTAGSQQLPKNYKPVARKVTMAIVALPIAIVTSYVLYQRLVLGEEKKLFPMPKQDANAGGEVKIEPSNSGSSSSSSSSPASSS